MRCVITAGLLGLLAGCSSPPEEPTATPLVTVTVAAAEIAEVQVSVRASGLVHPRQQASVAARITAPIHELLVGKGDRVAAGALLARLDSRDLVAQRDDALAAVRQAEVLAERRRHLFDEGAIPQRDLLAAETELAQLKARLEVSNTQLAFSELRSPFAGSITEQLLYPGDMAQPGSPVFTVADVAVVVARAQVPQADSAALESGQTCTFVSKDIPGAVPAGRITVINRAVDSARRTEEAWCEIRNTDGRLIPGTFGEVQIAIGPARKSVVVPQGAVQLEEGSLKGVVFVVDAAKVAHRKDIEAGLVVGGKMEIRSGLAAGETVVVEGSYALPDGAAVRVADSPRDPVRDDK
jgi:RND family efflux transporter MFP subunit